MLCARGCRTGIAVTVAVLATAVAAVAATPNAGQWITSGGEGSGTFVVKGATIVASGSGAGKAITVPSTFKCNASNLVVKATTIKISGGRFTYDGPAYVDKFRDKSKLGHLTWNGTFTSSNKVKGKIRFTSTVTPKLVAGGKVTYLKKKCDSGSKSWSGQPLGAVSLG